MANPRIRCRRAAFALQSEALAGGRATAIIRPHKALISQRAT
jgi:hypothetical protein